MDGSPGSVWHRRTARIAPGFVDLQANGFAGIDFLTADTDGYRQAGEALLETGVTAFLPTFITAPEEQLLAALREVLVSRDSLGYRAHRMALPPPRPGIHSSRLSPQPRSGVARPASRCGACPAGTLAPELPGASALIERLLRREIAVSCGHSDATADQANAAFDLGVRSVTHLFNAMRPFHHRDPRSRVRASGSARRRGAQLIVDWCTSPVITAAMVWQAAQGRVALVTDAVAGAALEDGTYRLGDPRRRDLRGAGARSHWRACRKHAHDDRRSPQPPPARRTIRGRNRSRDGGPRPSASAAGTGTDRDRAAGRRRRSERRPRGRAGVRRGTRACRRPSSPRRPRRPSAHDSSTRSASSRKPSSGWSRPRTSLLVSQPRYGPVPPRRHAWSVTDPRDNAASYGVYAFGCCRAGQRCGPRSRSPSTTGRARHVGLHGSRSQSGRTPDAVEYAPGEESRRVHGRRHERPRVGARSKPTQSSSPGRPATNTP